MKNLFIMITVFGSLCAGALAGPESAFDSWDANPLEKKLGELLEPAEPKEAEKPTGDWLPDDKTLREQAPLGGEDAGKGPLTTIYNHMQGARQLIAQRDVSGKVTQVQTEIIDELDKLIKQCESQCKSSSSSSCNKPGGKPGSGQQASQRSAPKPGGAQASQPGQPKPGQPKPDQQAQQANRSNAASRQAHSSQVETMTDEELMRAVWGNLPQRMREQMLQSAPDDFLPKYREEIERYYRKLAEEETGE